MPAAWIDLALLLPPFTTWATWVYMGLLWFHLPYNWAAHSSRAIHPCRLKPPASHGVQLVERPFLAVPTWSVCCQNMEMLEDFPLRKDKKGLFDQPTFQSRMIHRSYGWDHRFGQVFSTGWPDPQSILLRARAQHSGGREYHQ